MKKILLLASCLLCIQIISAQLDRVEVDKVESMPGHDTYRVYAVLKSQTDLLDAVFSMPEAPILVKTKGKFYQNVNGGAMSKDINRMALEQDVDLKYDSWLTIGYEDSYMNAVLPLCAMKDSVIIVDDFREAFERGEHINTTGCSWFVTPDQLQARPDRDGRVLLMQLTTDKGAGIEGVLNLAGRWHDVDENGKMIMTEDGKEIPHQWIQQDISFSSK